MVKKCLLLGMLAFVLVFGMVIAGCDDPKDELYEADGLWELSISGQTATVTVNGNTWVFDGPSNDDSGAFHKNGNTATLYSNSWNANIGNATLTSNTTMVLTLHSPSYFVGTFNLIKN